MSKFEENIKTILTTMIHTIENETKENYELDILKLQNMFQDDKNFFSILESADFKFRNILRAAISIPNQKNMYIIDHILSGLYEHFFNNLMNNTEGRACCADKSRFIRNMTLKALKKQENLSLYQDYVKVEKFKDDPDKERQAYWSPKTIKDTNDAMKMFWDWYLLREPKDKDDVNVKFDKAIDLIGRNKKAWDNSIDKAKGLMPEVQLSNESFLNKLKR
jgi:hypothetical protein